MARTYESGYGTWQDLNPDAGPLGTLESRREWAKGPKTGESMSYGSVNVLESDADFVDRMTVKKPTPFHRKTR